MCEEHRVSAAHSARAPGLGRPKRSPKPENRTRTANNVVGVAARCKQVESKISDKRLTFTSMNIG
jgi:hypothetical protein